jgi:glutaminase
MEIHNEEGANNVQVFWAASEGNLHELIRLNNSSVSLFAADYDGRTPIMLAASNGHLTALQYILV